MLVIKDLDPTVPLKCITAIKMNLFLSVILDSLSCSFTSIPLFINSYKVITDTFVLD